MTTSADSPSSEQSCPPCHQLTWTVHIFDTDCYGVVWHGAYTKWLEMGRVELLRQRAILMRMPNEAEGLLFPVVSQQLRFRQPGRLNDPLTLTTSISVDRYKLVFTQTVTCRDAVLLEAETVCVAVDGDWRPLRHLPSTLLASLNAA